MYDVVRKYRALVVVAVFVLTSLTLVLARESEPAGGIGVVARPVMGAAVRAQGSAAYAFAGVGGLWRRYIDIVGVGQENQELRRELHRLREENTRLLGVMQENARLRQAVGFREEHPQLELVAARVVAREQSSLFRVLSLRIEAQGRELAPGMPVVSSAGLVGQVTTVDGRSAQVLLAVDPRSSIDVLAQRNRARGILRGLGHSDDYAAEVAYLLRRDAVEPGDMLVTSGMGERFPRDLPVGRISAVRNQHFGMYQDVRVEPAVDFSRIEEVYVVVGERAAGDR